jgi:hypothetical protein
MMFRKKAPLVSAFQWFRHGDLAEVTAIPLDQNVPAAKRAKLGWLPTPSGGHLIFPGEWIITDHKGSLSSCNPLSFARLYEPAESMRVLPLPSQQGRSA